MELSLDPRHGEGVEERQRGGDARDRLRPAAVAQQVDERVALDGFGQHEIQFRQLRKLLRCDQDRAVPDLLLDRGATPAERSAGPVGDHLAVESASRVAEVIANLAAHPRPVAGDLAAAERERRELRLEAPEIESQRERGQAVVPGEELDQRGRRLDERRGQPSLPAGWLPRARRAGWNLADRATHVGRVRPVAQQTGLRERLHLPSLRVELDAVGGVKITARLHPYAFERYVLQQRGPGGDERDTRKDASHRAGIEQSPDVCAAHEAVVPAALRVAPASI